jgi:uncharacterized protein YegL
VTAHNTLRTNGLRWASAFLPLQLLNMRKVLLLLLAMACVVLPAFAQARDLTISGQVTCAGDPLPGVSIQIAGAGTGAGTTDSKGMYGFNRLMTGTYTITPSLKGFAFTPISRTVSVATSNVSNVNFVALRGTVVSVDTATILVMDVSGSMAWSWKGGVKIDSAKKAALQFIEQVANEPRPAGTTHEIGLVTFTGDAQLALPLTSSYAQARNAVIQLQTVTSTNIGSGLSAAIRELDGRRDAKRFIILLSDGESNTGLSKSQILAGPVVEARSKGICIYAVAFGDPGDIDEDFLTKVAHGSGCGTYSYAASGFQLFGTYMKVRHSMLGSNRIVDFTSGPSPVTLFPGQSALLGAFQLTAPAQELHYTLAWSEPGRMTAILVDPSNTQVTPSYPGATLYSGNGFTHVTVQSPRSGVWRVSAMASTSFVGGVQYYGVTSARTGGIVIPWHVPKPFCITILETKLCVPLPDMPTVLVVGLGLVVAAVVLYQFLLTQ